MRSATKVDAEAIAAAKRLKVVAYDPYVQPARAAQLGVKLLSLDELLEVSDFITVHLPKTPETVGLIGDEALHKLKPEVRIVNAARGEIVDEQALPSPAGGEHDADVAGDGEVVERRRSGECPARRGVRLRDHGPRHGPPPGSGHSATGHRRRTPVRAPGGPLRHRR
ncbi:hypothetical protein GCM10009579_02520 [Streptomyces javensis]|uniref:D-isomer specific 2-hydroxyacid dehydrogenase NAD-binding domain-containing protein n=1 Tax=Streptomyces javensis TaxID=114698 RepID=A0ABP4H2S0_9ACTN